MWNYQPAPKQVNTAVITTTKGGIQKTEINGKVVKIVAAPKVEQPMKAQVAEPQSTPAEPSKVDVEQLIRKYFGDDADTAIKVARCESGLNPLAEGDTNTPYHSIGVFQIRLLPDRGLTVEEMQDPENNIAYAKMLYDKSGWKPWLNTKHKLGL